MKPITLFFIIALISNISLQAQTTELWGLTSKGGTYDIGTIFKTDGSGNNHQVVHNFFKNEGNEPDYGELCEHNNGMLYGMIRVNGVDDCLFEFDPTTSTYTKKISFTGPNGELPTCGLMKASNGKLYGMTPFGGSYYDGVIFEYDPATATYAKKYNFNEATDGKKPYGKLVEDSTGLFYGMTRVGGTNDKGIIFSFNLATQTLTKLIDFNGTTNGSKPFGSLVKAINGKLYGMTKEGGANNQGVLFEFNTSSNTFAKILDFNTSTTGSFPYGSLIQSSNGKLYGMTGAGGTNYNGVIFEFNPSSSTYTIKYSFSNPSTNGAYPYGDLFQASNGKLYGMTSGGGINNDGVIFEFDPSLSTYNKLFDFDDTEGRLPRGNLMQAANGKLYGMTVAGGILNAGVLFEYDLATSNYTKKLDFDNGPLGSKPNGSLMKASNGLLYGMTTFGGANNQGVIFEYNRDSLKYRVLFDFSDSTGYNAYGSLFQATNGKLYGMSIYGGGAINYGVLFEYDITSSTFTKILDFDGTSNGGRPYGSLIQAANGKLYGLTSIGGYYNGGVLFEYDTQTSTYTKKIDFTSGSRPYGSLFEASNGKLYGLTNSGGINNYGALFEYDIASSSLTKKVDFDRVSHGEEPYGSLVESSVGKLYGLVNNGGANFEGVLFEYNFINSTFTKKIDFDEYPKGKDPYGSLIKASNNKLYGMTSSGGSYDKGVLFEYNPTTSTYTKKLEFSGANGESPMYGNLIEINTCEVHNTVQLQACKFYTWIDGNTYYNSNNAATHKLTSTTGCDSILHLDLTIDTVDTRVITNDPVISAVASNATFQWLDCNTGFGAISGATNTSYTPTMNGDYAVEVTQNNCIDTSLCVLIQQVGINSPENQNLPVVYPNPSKGIFTIDLKDHKPSDVRVYDTQGKLIFKEGDVTSPQFKFSLESVKGVYILELQNQSSILRYHIILN